MLFTCSPVLSADNGAIDESPLSTTVSDALEDANKLYKLGLFKGVGTDSDGTPDFQLERTATRNEAVTMLVRLLGKDETANGTEWTIPFTDVDEWAKPYVGYAYNYALTGGTSADTFSGNADITAAQYVTFVLRALGYVSEIHFPWHSPWELSDSIGLTNGEYGVDTANFTRADIVLISTRALQVKIKNSEQALADKLIDDGVIERRDYVELIEGGVYLDGIPEWDGSALEFKGRGTKFNPYLIESAEQLAQLAVNVAEGNTYRGKLFRLTTDIDLGMSEWTPIGSYDNPFEGIFDGEGHTIHNMYISKFSASYVGDWNEWHDYLSAVGLFAMLEVGEIKNLTVNGKIELDIDATVDKNSIGVGGIVGIASGKITNCHNECDITALSESKMGYVTAGGIAGYYHGKNCVIEDCTNTGDIRGYALQCVRIGGIAGNNDGNGTVVGCVNYGSVYSDGKSNVADSSAGGITAKTYDGTILNCQNHGSVFAKKQAGGIVGYQNGSDGSDTALIEGCFNTGKVTAPQSGGIAGALYVGTIRNCCFSTESASLAVSSRSDGTNVENVTLVEHSD